MGTSPDGRKRPLRLLINLSIAAVLLLLMLWLGGVFSSAGIAPGRLQRRSIPARGRTVAVREVETSIDERFEGEVTSFRTSLLAARVGAPIRTLEPRAGDVIEKGKPYGTLDRTRFEAAVAVAEAALEAARRSLATAASGLDLARAHHRAAKADLDLAGKEHARIERLVERGSATASELDAAVARLRKAEAGEAEALAGITLAQRKAEEARGQVRLREKELELARLNLEFTTLKSDVGGIVIKRLLEPGSHARPGQPILEIYDPKDLRLDVPVRETLVPGIDRSLSYALELPAPGRRLKARIVEIIPTAEPGSRAVRLRFGLPPVPGLLPGMSGTATLPVGRRRSLVVPEEALVRIGQLTYLDVVKNGEVERRYVRVGRDLAGGLVAVLDGVEAGEQVLLGGAPLR